MRGTLQEEGKQRHEAKKAMENTKQSGMWSSGPSALPKNLLKVQTVGPLLLESENSGGVPQQCVLIVLPFDSDTHQSL